MKSLLPQRHAPAAPRPSPAILKRLFICCLPLVLGLLCGCAGAPPVHAHRAFDFQRDTFAYSNELYWIYGFDTNGHWTAHKRPKSQQPAYALHCFVVARSAVQFFKFARFAPALPRVDDAAYWALIRKVVSIYPDHYVPEEKRIVIPGYADLRSFSAAHEQLLKENCGAAMQSYFQRGHWRMIFPFTRAQQEGVAKRLIRAIDDEGIAVVHVLRFPSLGINHAIVLFGSTQDDHAIQFAAYDPNDPSKPTVLTFDRRTRRFLLPQNLYFPGGPLNVYQVYHRWNY